MPASANETEPIIVSGVVHDDGTDPVNVTVDFGDGYFDTLWGLTPGSSFSSSHEYGDDDPSGTSSDPYTITLQAEDIDFNFASTSSIVTVNNLPPTLTVDTPPPASILAGQTVTVEGTVTDPSMNDFLSASIDWGDGSTDSYPGGMFSFSHAYSVAGTYTISVTGEDDDLGVSVPETFTLTVAADTTPPTFSGLTGPSPSVINEGDSTFLYGTVTDDSGGMVTLRIYWYDGAAPYEMTVFSGYDFDFWHTYDDDNPSATPSDDYTVTLEAIDADFNVNTVTFTVTVNNLDPTLTVDMPPPASILVGQWVTVSGSATDPSMSDTLSIIVDWGDGTSISSPGTSFWSDHQYSTAGTYTIAITAEDDDLGTDVATYSIIVSNDTTAPTFSGLSWPTTINEGDMATVSGTVNDDSTDPVTVRINWGDGSAGESTTVMPGDSFNFWHTYVDDDPTGTPSDNYTITLQAEDSSTNITSISSSVTVNNVAPTLFVDPFFEEAILEGGTFYLSGWYNDPGSADTHELQVDWGDGSAPETISVSGGSFFLTHQYEDDGPSPGNGTWSDDYLISLTLADDDSGTASLSLNLTVENYPPLFDEGASQLSLTYDEDGNVVQAVLSGTYTDPGVQDEHTLTVEWGDGFVESGIAVTGGSFSISRTFSPAVEANVLYPTHVFIADDDSDLDWIVVYSPCAIDPAGCGTGAAAAGILPFESGTSNKPNQAHPRGGPKQSSSGKPDALPARAVERRAEAAARRGGATDNNSPPQETIPFDGTFNAAAASSEAQDLATLNDAITEWRNNGWDLAADLLEQFTDQEGAPANQVYDFSEYSEKISSNLAFQTAWREYLTSKARALGEGTHNLANAPVAFKHRWGPASGELFYAFGGAKFGISNATLTVTNIRPGPLGQGTLADVTFTGDVRAHDRYTFGPTGFLGFRTWFPRYAAARRLEFDHAYTSFISEVKWNETFTGSLWIRNPPEAEP